MPCNCNSCLGMTPIEWDWEEEEEEYDKALAKREGRSPADSR